MRSLKLFSVFFVAFLISFSAMARQGIATTIILMRHAEKDTVGTNPPLSETGKKRAARLPVVFKKYKPDLFYSTATLRTLSTLGPWAKVTGKKILLYDASDQAIFSQRLKALTGKTIVVAGHSNTIPGLVNLIIGRNDYSDIPDNEFGRIWIITIRNGIASVKLRE